MKRQIIAWIALGFSIIAVVFIFIGGMKTAKQFDALEAHIETLEEQVEMLQLNLGLMAYGVQGMLDAVDAGDNITNYLEYVPTEQITGESE